MRNAPLLCAGLAALGLATAAADTVTLTNGSHIVGRIERMDEGKLILATDFAGTIEIDASVVEKITTDQPMNLGMTSGDRLVGRVEWEPAIDRAVVQTDMGDIPIMMEKVEAIWGLDARSPDVVALEAQIAAAEAEARAAAGAWRLIAEAGLFYQNGNKDKFSARGGITVEKKATRDLLRFYVTGDYAEENEVRSAAEVKAGGYYEYLFTDRVYGYGRIELEYDEFENLDLRVSPMAGVGYYWLKRSDHELKTRAGVGFLHESYMDDTMRDSVQFELGVDYRLDITPWAQFVHGTTYYPTVEGVDDYRLVSDSAVLIPLAGSEYWKIKLGALFEYKSKPNAGRERLDETYYANIVLDLK